ncbi:MAG: hypothetical protein HC930_04800 [Hydrococcus sp. SU_1_0]|nr:hypothetical protein [Hydrococcus sp. SU_1_0]
MIVETPFFTEPFAGTGKITINNQIVNVENLDGTFADKDLSVTGQLPILHPVPGLENPLTINLPPGKISMDKLYQGGSCRTGDGEGSIFETQNWRRSYPSQKGKYRFPKRKVPTAQDAVQNWQNQSN